MRSSAAACAGRSKVHGLRREQDLLKTSATPAPIRRHTFATVREPRARLSALRSKREVGGRNPYLSAPGRKHGHDPGGEKQAAPGRREWSYPEDTGATEDAGRRRCVAARARAYVRPGAKSELEPGLVLAIFGPTASGKTAVGEALCRRIPAEVVSADSMQVYRGLPILTNQPEMPTQLVGIWSLDQEASVAEYARLAHETIDELIASECTPVVVGGTGLYLRAALAELDLPPPPPPGTRERFERLYDRVGATRAHELLVLRDPAAAERVHPNDRRRVVRALELAAIGSSLHPARDRLWAEATRHPTVIAGLDVPRGELERRIEERARAMFERGVQAEVAAALERTLSPTARQVIGLREVAELPREQAIAAIAVRTRQYASYQRKWMRRIPGLVSVRADRTPDTIADEILEMARARQRLPADRAG